MRILPPVVRSSFTGVSNLIRGSLDGYDGERLLPTATGAAFLSTLTWTGGIPAVGIPLAVLAFRSFGKWCLQDYWNNTAPTVPISLGMVGAILQSLVPIGLGIVTGIPPLDQAMALATMTFIGAGMGIGLAEQRMAEEVNSRNRRG